MAEHEMKNIVCPHCNQVFDTLDGMKEHIFTNHRGSSLPTPQGQIRIYINEREYVLDVKPNVTLYDLIHDRLGLTGAKQFCDRGACGSCTVIMDGEPVLSCMILAIECDGKSIETVEGIAEKKHPLVESYAKNHAMQCGYCTPGFVTTSKAILDKNPEPGEQEIKVALSGNLCRCGTYPQHTIAVMEAAEKLKTNKSQER